jgi:hypothetical protein
MSLAAPSDRTARSAAVLAAVGFSLLAAFQATLAAGVPWGHAAWGGETAQLSTGQQVASAVAAVVDVLAALTVLSRAGVIRPSRVNAALVHRGTWFFAVAMALGAVPNFASQSRWENVVLGPLALALAALCTVVASSAAADGPHGRTGAQVRSAPRPSRSSH